MQATMEWVGERIEGLQKWVALPPVLTLILVIDVGAYFGGLVYWYGYVMGDPQTPMWAWAFIPDCPLFGLLGGMVLLMVTARKKWRVDTQVRAQCILAIVAGVSLLVWLSTYLPGVGDGWRQQAGMWGVWGWVMVVGALFFRQMPGWLLGVFAFGQIKFGIWTVTAWALFWRNTSIVLGAPLLTPDSVLMTVAHIGLFAQGVLLLTYFRPTALAALVSFGWFAWSDFVDYGLGFYPAVPEEFIPVSIMQWSTISVTVVLTIFYLWVGLTASTTPKMEPGQKERASQFA